MKNRSFFSVTAHVAQRHSTKTPRMHFSECNPRDHSRPAFWLTPVIPFRLDWTVWALRRRPSNLIDRWDGQTYRRMLVLGDKPVEVTVTQQGSPDEPRLKVGLASHDLARAEKASVRKVLEHLLGLRLDLSESYRLAVNDPKLEPRVSCCLRICLAFHAALKRLPDALQRLVSRSHGSAERSASDSMSARS